MLTPELSDVTIRSLEERDFDDLIVLFEAVSGERKWIGTEPGFSHEHYREGWRRVLAGRWGAVFVAVSQKRVVGCIGIHPHEEYGHVIGMLVAANHRGRGIGEALLINALNWAADEGLPDVSLLVFPHNTRAIALYHKFGFEQRDYYPNDVTRQTGEVWDTILMTKVLVMR
jgi:ribosomal protein S18 acetylase RimI-like enzyme